MANGPRAARIGKPRQTGYEGFRDDDEEVIFEDRGLAGGSVTAAQGGCKAGRPPEAPEPGEVLSRLRAEEDAPQGGCAGCFVLLLTLNAAIGGFLFGYDTGVVSGAMLQIKTAAQGVGDLTAEEQEVVVSSTVAFAVLGAVASGSAQSRLWVGRRGAILIGTGLFVVGALQMATAWDFLSLTAGRLVVGAGVGIASHTVPLYISECSPAGLRGRLSGLYSIMVVLGQVVAALVCCEFARAGVPQGWRFMLGLGGVPAVMMGLGFLILPESPRFLVLKGRGDAASLRQAEAVLTRLRGRGQRAAVAQELQQALDSLPQGERPRAVEVLQKPGIYRALALGCSLQLLQQLCGINTLMYYAATILQMSDSKGCGLRQSQADEVRDICLTAPLAVAQLVGCSLGMVLVDRCGRRPLTLVSLVGVCVSLLVLGATFHPSGLEVPGAPVWAMVVYLLFFGVGMSPMPWTVNAEIYPLEARALCIGIASATNWVSNFVVAATFLDLSRALSTDPRCPQAHPDGAFWLYGFVALVGLVGLAWKMPETRGLTLEEIARLFEGGAARGGSASARPTRERRRQGKAPKAHGVPEPDE